jgi:hypothetical protein
MPLPGFFRRLVAQPHRDPIGMKPVEVHAEIPRRTELQSMIPHIHTRAIQAWLGHGSIGHIALAPLWCAPGRRTRGLSHGGPSMHFQGRCPRTTGGSLNPTSGLGSEMAGHQARGIPALPLAAVRQR